MLLLQQDPGPQLRLLVHVDAITAALMSYLILLNRSLCIAGGTTMRQLIQVTFELEYTTVRGVSISSATPAFIGLSTPCPTTPPQADKTGTDCRTVESTIAHDGTFSSSQSLPLVPVKTQWKLLTTQMPVSRVNVTLVSLVTWSECGDDPSAARGRPRVPSRSSTSTGPDVRVGHMLVNAGRRGVDCCASHVVFTGPPGLATWQLAQLDQYSSAAWQPASSSGARHEDLLEGIKTSVLGEGTPTSTRHNQLHHNTTNMLFSKAIAIFSLLALQAVARPTGRGFLSAIYSDDLEVREVAPRSEPDQPHLVPRISLSDSGSDGHNLAQWIQTVIKWAANLHAGDMQAREDMLRGGLDILTRDYPVADGWHHFIFLQHKGFYYEIQYTDLFEESHEYKRKDLADSTERFKFVAFKGHGFLDKNGYDGGWANWAYVGGTREGERVTW